MLGGTRARSVPVYAEKPPQSQVKSFLERDFTERQLSAPDYVIGVDSIFRKAFLCREAGDFMPYVNIKITNEGITPKKKEQLIAGVTRLLVDVLGKNPETTVVTIDEVDTDNWGIGGEPVTERRKRGK